MLKVFLIFVAWTAHLKAPAGPLRFFKTRDDFVEGHLKLFGLMQREFLLHELNMPGSNRGETFQKMLAGLRSRSLLPHKSKRIQDRLFVRVAGTDRIDF